MTALQRPAGEVSWYSVSAADAAVDEVASTGLVPGDITLLEAGGIVSPMAAS